MEPRPLLEQATPPSEHHVWSCHIWEQSAPLSRLEPRPLSEQVTPRETGATPSLEQATPPSEHHVWSCHIWEQATPIEIGATPPFRTARTSAKLEPRPLRIGATPPYGTARASLKLEPRPFRIGPALRNWSHAPLRTGHAFLRIGTTPPAEPRIWGSHIWEQATPLSRLEPRPLLEQATPFRFWSHAPFE